MPARLLKRLENDLYNIEMKNKCCMSQTQAIADILPRFGGMTGYSQRGNNQQRHFEHKGSQISGILCPFLRGRI